MTVGEREPDETIEEATQEENDVPEGTPERERASFRSWTLGFFLGVAFFLAVLHLVEVGDCPRCEGRGIRTAQGDRISWAGADFGIPCPTCTGKGQGRRIWFYLGEDR